MDTAGLLDRSLRFDGVTADDSSYADRRALHLEWAQEIADEFGNERPFAWRLRTIDPLTIPANEHAYDLPQNFAEFGPLGGVFDTLRNGRQIDEISPQRIQLLQRMPPRGVHNEFAVFELSAGLFQLQVAANSGTQEWIGWYTSTVPELEDASAGATDAEHGLDYFPVAYHFTVLLNGLKSKIAEANGVMDAPWAGKYERAKARATAIDGQGRHSTIQVLPAAVNNW